MGYCQGLNYVATVFYQISGGDSQKTYDIILGLITKFKLKGIYMSKVYEYHLKTFVMQNLFKQMLP